MWRRGGDGGGRADGVDEPRPTAHAVKLAAILPNLEWAVRPASISSE